MNGNPYNIQSLLASLHEPKAPLRLADDHHMITSFHVWNMDNLLVGYSDGEFDHLNLLNGISYHLHPFSLSLSFLH